RSSGIGLWSRWIGAATTRSSAKRHSTSTGRRFPGSVSSPSLFAAPEGGCLLGQLAPWKSALTGLGEKVVAEEPGQDAPPDATGGTGLGDRGRSQTPAGGVGNYDGFTVED